MEKAGQILGHGYAESLSKFFQPFLLDIESNSDN